MRYILLFVLVFNNLFAYFDSIDSFEADFKQIIKDDKDNVITYKGNILASKPQNAMWHYFEPVKKDVYINRFQVTIIEPEIEQVIIREVDSNFDFFKMIKNAKKIKENTFSAMHKGSKFIITTKDGLIESISYTDEFENKVKIVFENQKQNQKINKERFIPLIPDEFDIIRD